MRRPLFCSNNSARCLHCPSNGRQRPRARNGKNASTPDVRRQGTSAKAACRPTSCPAPPRLLPTLQLAGIYSAPALCTPLGGTLLLRPVGTWHAPAAADGAPAPAALRPPRGRRAADLPFLTVGALPHAPPAAPTQHPLRQPVPDGPTWRRGTTDWRPKHHATTRAWPKPQIQKPPQEQESAEPLPVLQLLLQLLPLSPPRKNPQAQTRGSQDRQHCGRQQPQSFLEDPAACDCPQHIAEEAQRGCTKTCATQPPPPLPPHSSPQLLEAMAAALLHFQSRVRTLEASAVQ